MQLAGAVAVVVAVYAMPALLALATEFREIGGDAVIDGGYEERPEVVIDVEALEMPAFADEPTGIQPDREDGEPAPWLADAPEVEPILTTAPVDGGPLVVPTEERRKRVRKHRIRRAGPSAEALRKARLARRGKVKEPETPEEIREAKKRARRKKRRERQKERTANRKQCVDLGPDGVIELDEHSYALSRELVHCYAGHVHQFERMGSADWAVDENGKTLGIELWLRPTEEGDIARAAGIRNRDILVSVNRQKLRNWGQVSLGATQLYTRGRLRMTILRDGEEIVIHYRLAHPRKLERIAEKHEATADSE